MCVVFDQRNETPFFKSETFGLEKGKKIKIWEFSLVERSAQLRVGKRIRTELWRGKKTEFYGFPYEIHKQVLACVCATTWRFISLKFKWFNRGIYELNDELRA